VKGGALLSALEPILARWTAPVYPQLGPGERAITDVRLGGDTAVLTDRRVVVTGRNFEQSLPLVHISLVRVRFEHIAGNFVFAAIAILVALILLAVASPARSFLLSQATALEPAAQAERDNAEGHEVAQGMQRLVGAAAAIVRMLPALGWLLLLVAAAKIALGILGRTVVTLAASGGEVDFAKRGHDRALHDFIAEVGRQLPGAGRPPA
jgi:hypothetical protein